MASTSEWQEHEVIYHGSVPVVLKSADREDRSTALTVAITHSTGQPRNQKVLHVQLTDESDAFLLYTLEISEDDFHALKTEQNILVDFPTFPSKFIELLRQCQSCAAEEHPRFVAVLSTLGGEPVLTITETNPFRQLAHLALRFVAGNDAAIKRHLAGRVTDFKAQLLATSDELKERTSQLEATAERATAQAETLRTLSEDHARELHEAEVLHKEQLASAREAAASAQQQQSSTAELERQRLLERSEAELRASRRAEADAQARITELTGHTHELELRARESGSKLQGAEQEVTLLRKEGTGLRDENSALSARVHQLEKALSSREIELAAANRSASDKEALLAQTASLQEASTDGRRQLEESLAMYKEGHAKLQEKLQLSSVEITKGNGIIAKLQSDGRELKSKLKLRAQQLQQQAEQLASKQAEVDAAERATAEMRAQAAELRADKERAEEGAANCKQQLADAHELLRSNQQVIQWLNTELNQQQAGGRPYLGTPSARLAGFRPTLPSASASASASAVPSVSSSPSSSLPLPSPATTALGTSLTPTGAKAPTPTGASADASAAELTSPAASLARVKAAATHAMLPPPKPPAATRLDFEAHSTACHSTACSATAAPEGGGSKGYVPGAALASLRSRAGLALAENLSASDRARLGASTATDTASTAGAAFADYLSPSCAPSATSYGGVPLGTS